MVNSPLDRNSDLATAIRQRNVSAIDAMMFVGEPPAPRAAFRTETELWDYKGDCPGLSKDQLAVWAETAVHVLALHNSGGGILIFGVRDSDYSFCGATTRLDSKLVNDKLRRFLSDRIWVEFYRLHIQPDQRYLGIAIVPPRGPTIERFKASSPITNAGRRFNAGDSAIREKDSSHLLSKAEADRHSREVSIPTLGRVYAVDEPFFRVLNPDYAHFVHREIACREIGDALIDPRTSVASIIGVGGVGKTALATWAALRAFEQHQFGFIGGCPDFS
jgi:Schlafen, AlbA_2